MGHAVPRIVPDEEEADIAWADRCSYWLTVPTAPKRRGSPPRRSHVPLVLTGHGMHLRVANGALVVRNGFTHFPQNQDEWRFFPGDPKLPSRIVVVDGSGSVTFDVLEWLSIQKVPLIRINWRGEVQSVLSGGGYCGDPAKINAQRAAKRLRASSVAKAIIRTKIANSIETLLQAIPPSNQRQTALLHLRAAAEQLAAMKSPKLIALLGIEGGVAHHYFRAWHSLPLRWKGLGRKPIPTEWQYVGPRKTAIGNNTGTRNRRASHPVNAMLNYAYAVLENQIRIQVACEGYDPTIGFLHASKSDRDAFVLDLMEPLRPVVDRNVLEFVKLHTFHPADFTIRSDGVCRLNPDMARSVVSILTSTSERISAGSLFSSRRT